MTLPERRDRVFDIWERREGLFQYTRYIITAVGATDGLLMRYGDLQYQEGTHNRGWANHMRHEEFLSSGFLKVASGAWRYYGSW